MSKESKHLNWGQLKLNRFSVLLSCQCSTADGWIVCFADSRPLTEQKYLMNTWWSRCNHVWTPMEKSFGLSFSPKDNIFMRLLYFLSGWWCLHGPTSCWPLLFHLLPCQLCIEIDLSRDSQSLHNTSKTFSWDPIFYLYPCTFSFELFPLWAQVSHHAGQYRRQKFLQWWNTHTDTNQRVLRVFLWYFKMFLLAFVSQKAWTLSLFNDMFAVRFCRKSEPFLRNGKKDMVRQENNIQCMQISFMNNLTF